MVDKETKKKLFKFRVFADKYFHLSVLSFIITVIVLIILDAIESRGLLLFISFYMFKITGTNLIFAIVFRFFAGGCYYSKTETGEEQIYMPEIKSKIGKILGTILVVAMALTLAFIGVMYFLTNN